MLPKEIYLKRLSFIKYLYQHGVEQAKLPEPLSSTSILIFHDAIELFLQLMSEHKDIETKKSIAFIEYWDTFKRNSIDLSQKESMKRLNAARVALKHHGTMPSKMDIESFRISTEIFFTDNTKAVFQTDFDRISLSDLVEKEAVRKLLEEAETQVESGKYSEAIGKCAVAWEELVSDYYNRNSWNTFSLNLGKNMNSITVGNPGATNFVPYLRNLNSTISTIQNALWIIVLGIDYRKYAKFIFLKPGVSTFQNGNHEITWTGRANAFSRNDAEFCISFAIEAAIKLSEYEAMIKSISE